MLYISTSYLPGGHFDYILYFIYLTFYIILYLTFYYDYGVIITSEQNFYS